MEAGPADLVRVVIEPAADIDLGLLAEHQGPLRLDVRREQVEPRLVLLAAGPVVKEPLVDVAGLLVPLLDVLLRALDLDRPARSLAGRAALEVGRALDDLLLPVLTHPILLRRPARVESRRA